MKTFAIALAALAFAGSAHAATITNGSFEAPGTYSGPFTTFGAGTPAGFGWTVTGSIDLINTHWQASDGSYSLDMDGFGPGSISQDISGLVVGREYKVLFDMAGNPDGGAPVKTLTAAAGYDAQRYSFDTTGQSRGDMGWVTHAFVFTATANTETLEFMSTSFSGPWGPALDNVRLAPVPLPAGGVLLLGGLGLLALRRKA